MAIQNNVLHKSEKELNYRKTKMFPNSLAGFKLNTSEDRFFFNGPPQPPVGYNNNEVWFKAATIAVPICGALILFILIALAIKILRRDSIEQGFIHSSKHGGIFPPSPSHSLVISPRKPSQYHLHNLDDMSSKKVPLLLQHRNESPPTKLTSAGTHYEKNEANAKMNLAGKSCLLSEHGNPSDYTLLVQPLPHTRHDSPMSLLHKPNNTMSGKWGEPTGSASHALLYYILTLWAHDHTMHIKTC
ncbi:hypothetical protein L9F63_016125, partial [Diploptera punctata]